MLNSSIALHLFLDIGNGYEQTAVGRPAISRLTFWTTVKKLVQGKVIILDIKLKD